MQQKGESFIYNEIEWLNFSVFVARKSWAKVHLCHCLLFRSLGSKPEPCLYMLEQRFSYGCEFYGAQPLLGMTPHIDKCFLTMSQAVGQYKGAMVTGATGVGKTETVKVGDETNVLYKH